MQTTTVDTVVRLSLAFELLADIIIKYLDKQAPPNLRDEVFAIMEREIEEQLDFEMTAELLGSADFCLVS